MMRGRQNQAMGALMIHDRFMVHFATVHPPVTEWTWIKVPRLHSDCAIVLMSVPSLRKQWKLRMKEATSQL
jgi:hypothetical protein